MIMREMRRWVGTGIKRAAVRKGMEVVVVMRMVEVMTIPVVAVL